MSRFHFVVCVLYTSMNIWGQLASFLVDQSQTERNMASKISVRPAESKHSASDLDNWNHQHMFATCISSVPDWSYVKLNGALVYRKSYPPPERRSECPVSCSLDSCLSRRCLSLSLRLASRPPWPSCSLDVCLSSVRRSLLSACSLHTSWGSSSLRAWISCSLESCLSILWSLWKVLVWTWGSAWSLRRPGVPLEGSLCRRSRPGSCSTTSAITATSALPVPISPIINSLSLPFSRTFSSRLATKSGVTASSICLILGCRR